MKLLLALMFVLLAAGFQRPHVKLDHVLTDGTESYILCQQVDPEMPEVGTVFEAIVVALVEGPLIAVKAPVRVTPEIPPTLAYLELQHIALPPPSQLS